MTSCTAGTTVAAPAAADMTLMRSSVTWLVALLACLVTVVPTASLGLAVPLEIIIPLAMMFGALSSAIAASWAANFRVEDESRSRLLAVVGWTEVVAALLAGVFVSLILLGVFDFGLIYVLVAFTGIAACCATVASLRLRTTSGTVRRDATVSLGLVVVGTLVLFGVLLVTCSTGGCMP